MLVVLNVQQGHAQTRFLTLVPQIVELIFLIVFSMALHVLLPKQIAQIILHMEQMMLLKLQFVIVYQNLDLLNAHILQDPANV